MSVTNAERLKTPDGEASVIYGYAYRANPKEEGKFTVRLQGKALAPCKYGDDVMLPTQSNIVNIITFKCGSQVFRYVDVVHIPPQV